MRPMKLLLWAIRTDSLMDMSVRPQLVTIPSGWIGCPSIVDATPSSLHSRMGSRICQYCPEDIVLVMETHNWVVSS
jgi:hypothetical protein